MARNVAVQVKDYVSQLRQRQNDPIFEMCYDIHPDHQREFITTDAWKNDLISHVIFHGQLNPVIYHTIEKNDLTYYENLDGKQRSCAFMDLLNDKLKFKNTKNISHQNDKVNAMLTECSGKYFSQWPIQYQTRFKSMNIPVTLYDYEMDEKTKSDFFADLQNTKRTNIGEVLNAYGSKKIIQRIRKLMKECNLKKIWNKAPSRFADLHVFTCMAYHHIKNPLMTNDVDNSDLIEWIEKEGDLVSDEAFDEYSLCVHKTLDFAVKFNIPHKSAKNNLTCFFFLMQENTAPKVLDAIVEQFRATKTINFPYMVGKSDQAWRRSRFLTTEYIAQVE
jgi:hypothetical protein